MAATFSPIQKFPVVHTLQLFCFMIPQNYPKTSPMLLTNLLKTMTKNNIWSSLKSLELIILNKLIWEHCMVNNLKFHPSLGEEWLIKKSVYLPLLAIQVHLSCSFFISLWSENFFEVHYMSVGQKMSILKICPTIVTLVILSGLIKGSNWSLGDYLLWRFEF